MSETSEELKARCATCQCVAACKWTFRDFWRDKSHGGEGCECPMTPKHARAVEAAIADAKKLAEGELIQDELTAAKAEQDATFAPREWIVTHLRHTYETTAKTPEGAVNNIRFKLYGTRPMRTLAPFHAEPKRGVVRGNIPISRAAERLAKLAQAGRA